MDKLTMAKALELLNNAKDKIHHVEMRATPENITAVNESTACIQIVCNTFVMEMKGESADAESTKADV